jgi:hypothetical protein
MEMHMHNIGDITVKTTIEAMELAVGALTDGPDLEVQLAIDILRDITKREKVQSVEPVGYAIYAINGRGLSTLYAVKPWGGDDSMCDDGGQGDYWAGNKKLFTHPAPAKQPLSTERKALIAKLREYDACLEPVHRAADMLEADAHYSHAHC